MTGLYWRGGGGNGGTISITGGTVITLFEGGGIGAIGHGAGKSTTSVTITGGLFLMIPLFDR